MAASSAYLLAQSSPARGGTWRPFIQKHKLIPSWQRAPRIFWPQFQALLLGTFLGQPPGRLGNSHPAARPPPRGPRVRSPTMGSRDRVLPVYRILVGREWQERADFMFCTRAIGDSGEKTEPPVCGCSGSHGQEGRDEGGWGSLAYLSFTLQSLPSACLEDSPRPTACFHILSPWQYGPMR